jgi:hypothetical protein
MRHGSQAVPPRAAASPAALESDDAMTDTKRSHTTIAAVVGLALLLCVSLLALLSRGGEEGDPAAASPVAAPSTAGASVPREVPEPLTVAPQGVAWELFQGVALPLSHTDGPTRVDGPVHAGFSRTPAGALLADAQISYRSLVDPDVAKLRRVAEAQLADGPGKTAYLNLIGQLDGRNDPPAGGYAQVVAFRFISYTADLAVISLATRDKGGRIQVTTDTLRWLDGDWKLDLPASGLQQPQVVQDIAGYVPWAGVS